MPQSVSCIKLRAFAHGKVFDIWVPRMSSRRIIDQLLSDHELDFEHNGALLVEDPNDIYFSKHSTVDVFDVRDSVGAVRERVGGRGAEILDRGTDLKIQAIVVLEPLANLDPCAEIDRLKSTRPASPGDFPRWHSA